MHSLFSLSRATRLLCLTALALWILGSLSSCVTPATAIVVRMDSDVPDGQRLELQVLVSAAERPFVSTSVLSRGLREDEVVLRFPSSITVAARRGQPLDGQVRLRFLLRVLGRNQREPDRTITVERRLPFVSQRTTTLSVFFAARCANVRCPDGQSCGADGACTSIDTMAEPFDRSAEPDARSADVAPLCTPDCEGRQCGDDGCGGMCGACPSAMGASVQCSSEGRCEVQCAADRADCDGVAANGCEVSLVSASSCGRCGLTCGDSTPLCNGETRTCVSLCAASQTQCGGSCVNTMTDPAHCGACGEVCAVGANSRTSCVAGACVTTCDAGFANCNRLASDGCEVQLTNNAANCGACGTVCGGPAQCDAGVCVRAEQVATRESGACARMSDGALWCWGQNDDGSAGVGRLGALVTSATRVTALSAVSWVGSDDRTVCAVHGASRQVSCWGLASSGQLARADNTPAAAPVLITVAGAPLQNIAQVETDGATVCARTMDHRVLCWGASQHGQCGVLQSRVDTPTQIALPAGPLTDLSMGGRFACALRDNGSVWCWGFNGPIRALGIPSTTPNSPTPVEVVTASQRAIKLATGENHGCALLTSRSLACWGSNALGQIGFGVQGPDALRQFYVVGRNIEDVWAGVSRTCVRASDGGGRVLCTGLGPMGNGLAASSTRFEPVASLNGATQLSFSTISCSVNAGVVECWGSNGAGGLGTGGAGSTSVPRAIEGLVVDEVVAGEQHFLARRGTRWWSWGRNIFGESDDLPGLAATVNERTGPVSMLAAGRNVTFTQAATDGPIAWVGQRVSSSLLRDAGTVSGTNVRAIASGGGTTCMLTVSGATRQVQCSDDAGGPYTVIANTAGATAVRVGSEGIRCALVGGELRCWGTANSVNVFGATRTQPIPVLVGGIRDATDMAVGAGAVFAVRAGGQLFSMGNNTNNGELGVGDTMPRATPTAVVGLPPGGVRSVAAFGVRACAVTNESTPRVFCWGGGAAGFVAMPSISHSAQVTAGSTGALGVAVNATTGCMWFASNPVACWGSNASLGFGTDDVGYSLVPRPLVYAPAM